MDTSANACRNETTRRSQKEAEQIGLQPTRKSARAAAGTAAKTEKRRSHFERDNMSQSGSRRTRRDFSSEKRSLGSGESNVSSDPWPELRRRLRSDHTLPQLHALVVGAEPRKLAEEPVPDILSLRCPEENKPQLSSPRPGNLPQRASAAQNSISNKQPLLVVATGVA